MNRTKNVKRNSLYGLFNNIFTIVISFVTRTIFINTLGAEYLGLNGLFTNILGILSLADLGISSAITFSLYKPIAENDEFKISQILTLLKKAYRAIGIIMLIAGSAIAPFLEYIVNFENDISVNYTIIYFLFLFNSASGYLFYSYYNLIIYADQKSYLTTKYEMLYTAATLIIQLIVLVFLKNYYVYLIIPIIVNLLKNYNISLVSKKLYPNVEYKSKHKLDKIERKSIFKNIYSLALVKISGVIYSSTDNLLISSFISTTLVGYYSNYLMIINTIKSFVNILFSSMTASVGNLNSLSSVSIEHKYNVFRKLNLLNFIFYGYCFTCLLHLLNPFIKFWLGEQFLFDKTTVLLICLTFLIPGLNNIVNIFKDACGLFWETRFRTLATALINLISSIVLQKSMGIDGIFLGTIIAYLSTIYIVDPKTVFKNSLHKSVKFYYIELAYYLFILFIVNAIVYFISKVNKIAFEYDLINIIFELLICSIVFIIVIFLAFFKNRAFKELIKTILVETKILKQQNELKGE